MPFAVSPIKYYDLFRFDIVFDGFFVGSHLLFLQFTNDSLCFQALEMFCIFEDIRNRKHYNLGMWPVLALKCVLVTSPLHNCICYREYSL